MKVVRILDDRTLRVRRQNGETAAVRLLGVAQGEQGAARRRQELRRMTAGETVTLSFDADRGPGESEVLLAYVYLNDGRLINEWLIEQGLARADRDVPHELSGWFDRLEGQSRTRNRGMWDADR